MGQIWVCLNLIHNLGKYEKENMGQIWVALSQIGLAGGVAEHTDQQSHTAMYHHFYWQAGFFNGHICSRLALICAQFTSMLLR